MKLVGIAFILSVPISYLGMQQWLDAFPYREEINPILFVLTGLSVFAVTISVVSYQAIATATLNPVRSLRSE
jgi:putative ABC transport system permease protein